MESDPSKRRFIVSFYPNAHSEKNLVTIARPPVSVFMNQSPLHV